MPLTLVVPETGLELAIRPDAVVRWFMTLGALGWPAQYIADQCGHPEPIGPRLHAREFTPELSAAVREWFEDHRDQTPTPAATGLTARQIQVARERSEREGWSTPEWYDDNGARLGSRERNKRISDAHKRGRALDTIEVLKLILNWYDDEAIEERVGYASRTVARIRKAAGLTGYFAHGEDIWIPDEPSRVRLKEIEQALNGYFADPDGDPHLTLYNLGIVQDKALDRERAERKMAS